MKIAWWSGGVTSAIACKIALDSYENVKVVMLDTMNEDEDTYRFKDDCEKWYGCEIEVYKHPDFSSIQEVWYRYLSLASATGAICSTYLKAHARELYCKGKDVEAHVFGFEYHPKEINRAENWEKNKGLKAYFPLIEQEITKLDSMRMLKTEGIEIPRVYSYGFNNNNCFLTGCTQAGVGYYKKLKEEFSDKYEEMSKIEHHLSELKGEPVTICSDQRADRIVTKWDISKRSGKPNTKSKLFLKYNPQFPEIPTIDVIKGKHVPIIEAFECNGFCSLEKNENQLDFMELLDNA
jgi:3'-phosphoadenosine 5'-phosphosulfate sulfotransferase (PAPS reductase)/FAD synthetase